jgi:predicted site-specific integrase-resolvase
MPITIDPNVRRIYYEAKDSLLRSGYGMKAAMLDAKRRIIEYEKAQRANQKLESEGILGALFESFANSISNNTALAELEN